MERQRKPKKYIFIWSILGALVLVAGFFVIFFGQRIIDFYSGRDYEPTPEMAKIIERLELTDEADLILRAVHPVAQESEEFNKNCSNREEEMSTLGCFSPSDNRIYLFKIESEELDGINESVLAHELLHAIYQRMNNIERTGVNRELDTYYKEHQELFGDYLTKYSDEQYYTELHSVIGQRIKSDDLPHKLRDHYIKYFKNQDNIANFYAKYRAIFDDLKQNIESLSAKIEGQRTIINEKRESYQNHLNQYEEAADAMRRRTEKGQYNSIREQQAAYAYVRELYEALENERLDLNKDIKELNDNVRILNEYIERSNSLNRIINSHADTKTEGTPQAAN